MKFSKEEIQQMLKNIGGEELVKEVELNIFMSWQDILEDVYNFGIRKGFKNAIEKVGEALKI